jgi:hypothetical protein
MQAAEASSSLRIQLSAAGSGVEGSKVPIGHGGSREWPSRAARLCVTRGRRPSARSRRSFGSSCSGRTWFVLRRFLNARQALPQQNPPGTSPSVRGIKEFYLTNQVSLFRPAGHAMTRAPARGLTGAPDGREARR